ncbi:murein biosynthesis integral membrane protein MurJ [Agrococcus lahaulensis]|uniref:murein biosynthesis integral membrane protein MurJ n=1 Tax=Agrococcus lahaulensis TaxID=341722 RepID=UPI0003FEC0F1|nr:murein biosynthesis integral membrane protein MurJ [Agrococcus lahaulensis]
MPERRGGLGRAAFLVTALTAVSTLLGFVRDVVIAAVFGASASLDAYLVAQGLMNIVLALIATAMARSATPVLAREAEAEDACRGHRSFDVAITVTMIVLGVGSIAMGLLAAPVTAILAPGFDGAQAETAQHLTRIVLIASVLIAGTNLLASYSQAHGSFAWSALQGVPFNIIMIGAAGLLGPTWGISALAVGFVLGSLARLLLQLPPLVRLGARVRPSLRLRDPGFREIAGLVPPMLVGNAVGNINTLVDRAVGSTLDEGAITAVSYAWRLVSLPETLLIASLLVPLYPAMGAAANRLPELGRLVGRGLSAAVTLLTPICIVLALAAQPLVELAFGRGAFDDAAVAATASAVVWFTPALLALGCRQVVVSASYARRDSRAPVLVAVAAMVVNIVGDVLLAPVMGVAGLALASSASLGAAAVANTWLLHRRHGVLDLRATGALVARAAGVGAVAALGGGAVLAVLPGLPPVLDCAIVAIVVGGIYVAGLAALRAPELAVPLDMVRAAVRRRRR